MKTAEQILNSLTLDQKLAQLVAHGSSADFVIDKHFNKELAREKYPHGVFGFMIPFDLEPMELGVWVSEMLEHFKYCNFDTSFRADNLEHAVFNLYF